MAIKSQPFYAVRVAVYTPNGTETRDYVRGEWRISKDKFASFALGDMIHLTSRPSNDSVRWLVTEVTGHQVYEGARYEHTSQPGFHA